MRVLIANTRHYPHGGDSTYTFALADALRSADHHVGFFAMAGEKNQPDPNEDLFVSYIDFRDLNRHKSVATGLRVLRRTIFSSEAEDKFIRLVERSKPDVVHLQNIHAHLTPSIVFAASRLGLPVVWTLHDYKLMCPNSHFRIDETGDLCEACRPGRYHWAMVKRCKKDSLLASTMAAVEAYAHWARGLRDQVQAFLCPSRFLADKLLEHGWSPDRVRHVPNFIDCNQAPVRRGEGNHFLFVGRLEELKGVNTLLDAAEHVGAAPIVLVGECDDPGIRARLGRLPRNVRYVGPKTREEIAQLLVDARALVIPSVCYENQPMVVLEAFAAGVPVIGSRIGGIPELVNDERGLLFEAGSSFELSQAIRKMHRDPAKAVSMGDSAREYVVRQHSVGGHISTISEIYRHAIATTDTPHAAAV